MLLQAKSRHLPAALLYVSTHKRGEGFVRSWQQPSRSKTKRARKAIPIRRALRILGEDVPCGLHAAMKVTEQRLRIICLCRS